MLSKFKKCLFIILIQMMVAGCDSGIKFNFVNGAKKNLPSEASVSTIHYRQGKFFVTGNQLLKVTSLKIIDGENSYDLLIDTKNNNAITAIPTIDLKILAEKAVNFLIGEAHASSVYRASFSLCDADLDDNSFDCSVTALDKDVLSYDASTKKWKPRSINGLSYRGSWDPVANPTPPSDSEAGDYYIISQNELPDYYVGDWIVFNGTEYNHIKNSNVVISVHGRSGAIVAVEGDYDITKLSDVTITTPVDNQVLVFEDGEWINKTLDLDMEDSSVRAFARSALPTCSAGKVLTSNGTTFDCNTDNGTEFTGTASRLVVTGTDGKLLSSSVTTSSLDTVLSNNSGVSGNIQTQIDAISEKIDFPACTSTQVLSVSSGNLVCVTDAKGADEFTGTASSLVGTDADGELVSIGISTTEAMMLEDISSNIQDQLDAKQATISATTDLTIDALSSKNQSLMATGPAVGEFRFYTVSGTTYTGFKAPDTLASSIMYTLPATAGTAGQVLAVDASSRLSWTTVGASNVSLNTSEITEDTNLYFTEARVLATPINPLTTSTSAVVLDDTILTSIGKLQGQISAATNVNTNGQIVKRDASGNFSAGTITANLTGNATGLSSTLAVGSGGTGLTSVEANGLIVGNGTSALDIISPVSAMPSVLLGNSTTGRPEWVTSTAGNFLKGSATGVSFGTISTSDLPSGLITGAGTGGRVPYYTGTGSSSALGDSSLNVSGTNISVGTPSNATATNTKLNVEGQIRSKSFSTTTNNIDWAEGNSGTTSYNCASGNLNLANLRDGGSYLLAVTSTSTTQCNFNTSLTGDDAATVTYRFSPFNSTRTASSHTIYSFQRIGSIVYISWISGF